jgi:hypothetical protein
MSPHTIAVHILADGIDAGNHTPIIAASPLLTLKKGININGADTNGQRNNSLVVTIEPPSNGDGSVISSGGGGSDANAADTPAATAARAAADKKTKGEQKEKKKVDSVTLGSVNHYLPCLSVALCSVNHYSFYSLFLCVCACPLPDRFYHARLCQSLLAMPVNHARLCQSLLASLLLQNSLLFLSFRCLPFHRVSRLSAAVSSSTTRRSTWPSPIACLAFASNSHFYSSRLSTLLYQDTLFVGRCLIVDDLAINVAIASRMRRWCECSCDVHLCSLMCCSLGGASALVTSIRVLCTLCARNSHYQYATSHTTSIIIIMMITSRSICNFTHCINNNNNDDNVTINMQLYTLHQ